jgi:cell division transport system permease protein
MSRGQRAATAGVTLTAAVVLTLAGGCWLAAWNAWTLMRAWRADVKVVVYLRDAAAPEEIDAIRAAIASEPAVRTHHLVTQAEAEAEFLRFMQLDRSALEGLGDNPFPASIEVSVADTAQTPSGMAALARRWATLAGVEDVRFGEALIRDLSAAARLVWIVGAVIGGALAAVAVVIGVMVHSSLGVRREEISLLRLLGAPDGVILKPFLLEGLAIGTMGGLAASVVLGGAWLAVHERWGSTFEGLLAAWIDRLVFPMEFVPLLIGLGAIVGGAGSVVAARRVRQLAP